MRSAILLAAALASAVAIVGCARTPPALVTHAPAIVGEQPLFCDSPEGASIGCVDRRQLGRVLMAGRATAMMECHEPEPRLQPMPRSAYVTVTFDGMTGAASRVDVAPTHGADVVSCLRRTFATSRIRPFRGTSLRGPIVVWIDAVAANAFHPRRDDAGADGPCPPPRASSDDCGQAGGWVWVRAEAMTYCCAYAAGCEVPAEVSWGRYTDEASCVEPPPPMVPAIGHP